MKENGKPTKLVFWLYSGTHMKRSKNGKLLGRFENMDWGTILGFFICCL
jgi:hypothetical protein